jgi:dGTPase
MRPTEVVAGSGLLETLRQRMLEAEEATLSVVACRSRLSTRRRPLEEDRGDLPGPLGPLDYRTAFARDRDRIIHSRAFRRLKHKTQVFIPFEGDHYRTRLTHTLEVSQIGRSIARALRLNEDLVEACALGHDLGHTPFGHSGEKVLNWILTGADEQVILPAEVAKAAGAFKHNYQSVRIVDLLERRYAEPGINLTDEVREGMLKHTEWKREYPFPIVAEGLALDSACHLEGQVVYWADEIAQQAHDLEDGLPQIDAGRLRELEIVRRTGALEHVRDGAERIDARTNAAIVRGIVGLLTTDLVAESLARIEAWISRERVTTPEEFVAARPRLSGSAVSFSAEGARLYADLKDFVYRYVIQGFEISRNDGRARLAVRALFAAYHDNPRLVPDYVLHRYSEETGLPYLREVPLSRAEQVVRERYRNQPVFLRMIADHVAGMTDSYALDELRALTGAAPSRPERH